MNDKKNLLKEQLLAAQGRLEDVLRQPPNEFIRDSAIQRFEFVFELAWKTLKVFLEERGILAVSPRDAIKGAFQVGYIADDPVWLEIIKTRNSTAHVYSEEMAERIYALLPGYAKLFRRALCDRLATE